MCMCAHACVCKWMCMHDVSVRCDFLYVCEGVCLCVCACACACVRVGGGGR